MEPRESGSYSVPSFLSNLNKNTKTKTKSDMKVITDFFTSISIGEERVPGQISPKDHDSIMARFFLCVLKKDGTEYEHVSVNIFLKDHRIMSYCMTESVDGQ
jgi:hypothetical protein